MEPDRRIGAARLASLVAGFDRDPSWAGLAAALRELIGDGRLGLDLRLPSERELSAAVGLSRTTVTKAYETLRESGYARSRTGAGTWTAIPGGSRQVHDHLLLPGPEGDVDIDLTIAAASAPPGLVRAYEAAVADLPSHLAGSGYSPQGIGSLRELIAQRYTDRGLPTTADEVMITAGGLAAVAATAQAFTAPRQRVAMESPTYPNAAGALGSAGASLVAVPVDAQGWDVEEVLGAIGRAKPQLAYLIPDFHNPTGHLMSSADRALLAGALADRGILPLIDEVAQPLAFDDELAAAMPEPFGCHHRDVVTIGSASKSHWGGLRLGWARAPRRRIEALVRARTSLDLGAPILDQLALIHLLTDGDAMVAQNRRRLREGRDAVVDRLRERLPQWQFVVPQGGVVLWCRLPVAAAVTLSEVAATRGLLLAPGPVFAVEGGLNQHLRLPLTRPVDELVRAVDLLAELWPMAAAAGERSGRGERFLVA